MVENEHKRYPNGTALYWCVNCGHNGYYGYRRMTNFTCQECNYEGVTPYELTEILEDEHLKSKFQKVFDENPLIIRS